MEVNKIYNGDCLEIMKSLPDNLFDAKVSDPPYGLSFMGKKWDYNVPSISVWQESYRIMKPGAFGLISCGTRTQHRMVCNIEDAGFEIRDVITWHYGNGFPKSLNCGEGRGTALKPATEFWTLIRKPISEKTVALNIAKWGTGAINIDSSRIALNGEQQPSGSAKRVFNNNGFNQSNTKYGNNTTTPESGRFPANVIFDEYTAGILDEQTGILKSGDAKIGSGREGNHTNGIYGAKASKIMTVYADEGGASRFFYCAKSSKSERNKGLEDFDEKFFSMRPQSTTEESDRGDLTSRLNAKKSANHHPTVKPLKLMRYLVKMVTPPSGIVLDCFGGSGTTGIACKMEGFNYVLIEREKEYCDIAEARIKAVTKDS